VKIGLREGSLKYKAATNLRVYIVIFLAENYVAFPLPSGAFCSDFFNIYSYLSGNNFKSIMLIILSVKYCIHRLE
jgi:hypothetical protein